MTQTTEKLVKAPRERVKRNPVEGRNKLTVKGKDPNYVYRFFNDTDGRIHDALDRGWEFEVSDEIRVGDSRVDQDSRFGAVRVINVGGGIKAILMKQRKEWYDEDQLAKQDYVKKTELAMRPSLNEGTYGEVKLDRK